MPDYMTVGQWVWIELQLDGTVNGPPTVESSDPTVLPVPAYMTPVHPVPSGGNLWTAELGPARTPGVATITVRVDAAVLFVRQVSVRVIYGTDPAPGPGTATDGTLTLGEPYSP